MQRKSLSRMGYNLSLLASKVKGRIQRTRGISLKPELPSQGNVILSYYIEPFLLKPGQIPNSHTYYWECLQIAKTFLEFGYCVDVISYSNEVFLPQKEYAFFIEVRWTLERVAPLLNKDCVKIMHIDVAHTLFQHAAESQRLLALQQRRGVTICPRRF